MLIGINEVLSDLIFISQSKSPPISISSSSTLGSSLTSAFLAGAGVFFAAVVAGACWVDELAEPPNEKNLLTSCPFRALANVFRNPLSVCYY